MASELWRQVALSDLLAEAPSRALQLEEQAHRRFKDSTDIVIFGAGGLGRRILAGLRQSGVEPRAFSDNDAGKWGREVDGVVVLSPEDMARAWGTKAVVVVSIWRAEGGHVFGKTKAQLEVVGCRNICSFLELAWVHPDRFLPYLAADRPTIAAASSGPIEEAFGLFDDGLSRREFLRQAQWRLTGDFSAVESPSQGCDAVNEYWPDGLYAVGPHERVVDCGAFDGDTLARFIDRFGGCDSWLAFEPDPVSARALRGRIRDFDPEVAHGVVVREAATGSCAGNAGFAAFGTEASCVVMRDGGVRVPVVTLDNECCEMDPTLIKLDVEGQEVATLEGATRLLGEGRAVWAISCYHRQQDLWELPILVRMLMPRARLHLRAHAAEAFDLVLYAVPQERAASGDG